MTIRLLIADDHDLVREGLRSVFATNEFEVVGEATTGDEAVRMALNSDVDVVLLDIKMPGKDGFEVLQQIKPAKPDLPVLMYSQYDRSDFKQRACELAASGYLVKGIRKTKLIEAVRSVNCGATLWDDGQLSVVPCHRQGQEGDAGSMNKTQSMPMDQSRATSD